MYRLIADILVLLHLGFILYVLFGGLICLRWPRNAWLHIPAVIWGLLIEFFAWRCPLTPLEIKYRELAGEAGYSTGFIEHYIIPLIYPVALTRELMIGTGIFVLLLNVAIYLFVWKRVERSYR